MEWKQIEDYPNYRIFKDGKIVNLTTSYVLKHTETVSGECVRLTKDKKGKNFSVHRLLAQNFLPNPENLKEVTHRDGNKKNNDLNNLIWVKRGEWNIKYETMKEKIEARRKSFRESREKRKEKAVEEGKKWRQTDSGIFIRNRNHWKEAGIREPECGWKKFWEIFKNTNHCELCNIEFDGKNNYMTQRCLDHDHFSRYKRFIVCRKCNTSCIRKTDSNKTNMLIEIHRYFINNLYN